MLVRCWQAAILAAILPLTFNPVGAQSPTLQQTSGNILQVYRDALYLSAGKPAPCPAAINHCGDCCVKEKCCADQDGCASGKCCKDGACCSKCDAKCECCKDNKCECGKGKDCCCGKDKECCKKGGCCADKTSGKNTNECPFLSKLAKAPMIVVLVPSALPFFGCIHPNMSGLMPPPPMPVGPAVMLPPPPPMLTPPGLPMPGLTPPIMPPQTVAFPTPPGGSYGYGCAGPIMSCPPDTTHTSSNADICLSVLGTIGDLCRSHTPPPSLPSMCAEALGLMIDLYGDLCQAKPPQMSAPSYVNQFAPPSSPSSSQTLTPQVAATILPTPTPIPSTTAYAYPAAEPLPAPVTPCAITTPVKAVAALTIRIAAKPYSDQLEMSIDDDVWLACKKMTLSLHDNSFALTRIDGRVRVRTEEMRATADRVRTDRKDRLVLEGDAVLSCHKDGQKASFIIGDRIELNFGKDGTVAVTVSNAAKTTDTSIEDGSEK